MVDRRHLLVGSFCTVLAARAGAASPPQETSDIDQLGKFELVLGRTGVVVGVPHGTPDVGTLDVGQILRERLGAGSVVVTGFWDAKTRQRVNVNRPTEQLIGPESQVVRQWQSDRAAATNARYIALVKEAAQGRLKVFYEIHLESQAAPRELDRVSTLGVSRGEAARLKAAFRRRVTASLRTSRNSPSTCPPGQGHVSQYRNASSISELSNGDARSRSRPRGSTGVAARGRGKSGRRDQGDAAGVADEVLGRPRRLSAEAVVQACCTGLVSLALGAAHGSTSAAIVEDQTTVPGKVRTVDGRDVDATFGSRCFTRSTSAQPRPLLVLNHGRAGIPASRAALRTSDYAAAARWLMRFGFVVAVPVRIGYGDGWRGRRGFRRVRAQGLSARLPRGGGRDTCSAARTATTADAAQDRAVVMGQSFRGTTAIAVAALDPAGVQGAINFAGGGGGGPVSHPQQPCSQPALRSLFVDYDKTARMPTLWLYSENDMYFGPRFPAEWFEAFKAAGGAGEYVRFPPVSDNGHLLFSRGTELWHPRVQEFLASLGYRATCRPPRRRP
jgi:dienelactone hydrolase